MILLNSEEKNVRLGFIGVHALEMIEAYGVS